MKHAILALGLIMLLLTGTGCREDMFRGEIGKYHFNLFYLDDNIPVQQSGNVKVFIHDVEMAEDLPLETVVETADSNFVYLVFAASAYDKFRCQLGQSSLNTSYGSFLKESLAGAWQRAMENKNAVASDSANADYVVRLKVQSIFVESFYEQRFSQAGNYQTQEQKAYPAVAKLKLLLAVDYRGQEIYQHEFEVSEAAGYINERASGMAMLPFQFVANLSEALTLATKKAVYFSIYQIDQVIQNHKRENSEVVAHAMPTAASWYPESSELLSRGP